MTVYSIKDAPSTSSRWTEAVPEREENLRSWLRNLKGRIAQQREAQRLQDEEFNSQLLGENHG